MCGQNIPSWGENDLLEGTNERNIELWKWLMSFCVMKEEHSWLSQCKWMTSCVPYISVQHKRTKMKSCKFSHAIKKLNMAVKHLDSTMTVTFCVWLIWSHIVAKWALLLSISFVTFHRDQPSFLSSNMEIHFTCFRSSTDTHYLSSAFPLILFLWFLISKTNRWMSASP